MPPSFLVACTRLYTPLCRSVGRSVGWSVGRSVTHLFFRRFLGSFRITAPAQSHATDSAVYTALFPSTRNEIFMESFYGIMTPFLMMFATSHSASPCTWLFSGVVTLIFFVLVVSERSWKLDTNTAWFNCACMHVILSGCSCMHVCAPRRTMWEILSIWLSVHSCKNSSLLSEGSWKGLGEPEAWGLRP